ncbi:MAG TPA: ATP-binding cassette domain-containing protein [Arenimonas sp.]|uniref:ribosomal protection-like ABC-F family protein n=1 Tax=Arenimonas sp. TaxID=1872635 RepID=UPI002D1C64E0|nr:ATP-binding cassette domain-containing protein [Arenimonas sp.]HMB58130.1 ATP-binding cassette domain-containing protein [Arenimonas sp.]
MISFKNFALRRGERLLLSNVDLTLHAGWRVGVIGRNGCGKSSLFATILGEIESDLGNLDMPSRLRIACIAQETPSLPDPAIDFVLGGDEAVYEVIKAEAAAMDAEDYDLVAECHHKLDEMNGYDASARAGRLLHGLGFPAETHSRPVSSFSGGWRVRLNLARALMKPSDMLLLDEPTNHLDLDAVLWLEQWLLKYPGTLLLISHDREFLDGVSTHTLHLNDGKAKLYAGDYTSFERQRAEHLRLQQISHEKEQAERAHLQSFIDRFKAQASKAKQAQSRVKRLAKLAGTEAVRAERSISINFADPVKLPHSLIRLNHVDAGYGATSAAVATENESAVAAHSTPTVILKDVGFGLEAGDRVGLLGPNGAGKSTLVKTLVGELPLLAGERVAHPDLKLGYFAQHTVESLHEGQSPLWHLKELAPNAGEQQLRNFLGQWNFVGDRAFESVDGFSGGERARLALALIAYQQPNVMLLDEPTNHLDLDMREALAEALSIFPGAIVLVSHDRHLIGLVCETFWRVADGKVESFNGDLDEYAAWLRSRGGSESKAAKAAEKFAAAAPVKAARSKQAIDAAAKRLKQVEARIATIQSEAKHIEDELADPAIYGSDGGGAVVRLAQKQGELQKERETLEAEWLTLYEDA